MGVLVQAGFETSASPYLNAGNGESFGRDQSKFIKGIADQHTPENALVLLAGYEWRAATDIVSANQWLRIESDKYQARSNAKKALEKAIHHHGRLSGYLASYHNRNLRTAGSAVALKRITKTTSQLMLGRGISAALDDSEINDMSKAKAFQCETLMRRTAMAGDVEAIRSALEEYCLKNHTSFPLSVGPNDDDSTVAQKILAAAARVSDPKWWRRQLRKITGRKVESVLRGLGVIRSGDSPYLSEYSYQKWLQRQKRSAEMLEDFEATTGEGLDQITISLSEAVASSVSNPVNRRNELMVRMRGYEEVATVMGFSGLFFTLTAPSKYHAMSKKRKRVNPKYQDYSPADTMDYLNGVWSKIRASWARKGIKAFGFRVAEPHHDGTPHFHLMLFMAPEQTSQAKAIFGKYALQEDGAEAGAIEKRWDVKEIDPAEGSAAGYMAKYVAKNIDGYAVDVDFEGACQAEEGAARTKAWASLWGIRQFQQIGSASVTVWRELRRRCEALKVPDQEIKVIHAAADSGDWAAFVDAIGGALARRDELLLRPDYQPKEEVINAYGESVRKLTGLILQGVSRAMNRCNYVTRDHVWTVQRRELEHPQAAQPPNLDL